MVTIITCIFILNESKTLIFIVKYSLNCVSLIENVNHTLGVGYEIS
jgi:hypothetical protein